MLITKWTFFLPDRDPNAQFCCIFNNSSHLTSDEKYPRFFETSWKFCKLLEPVDIEVFQLCKSFLYEPTYTKRLHPEKETSTLRQRKGRASPTIHHARPKNWKPYYFQVVPQVHNSSSTFSRSCTDVIISDHSHWSHLSWNVSFPLRKRDRTRINSWLRAENWVSHMEIGQPAASVSVLVTKHG